MSDDLTRLREIAAAATPGPWEYGDRWHVAGVMSQFGKDKCCYCERGGEPSWTGRLNINGERMDAHVHTDERPWHPHGMFAVREDGPVCVINDTDEYGYLAPADAEFIATFDPPTVTALIDRAERAERERDWWKQTCEGWAASCKDAQHRRDVNGEWLKLAEAERDAACSELAALRAAVAGLADDWHVIDADQLRALLTDEGDKI